MPAGRLQQFSVNGSITPALRWWDAEALQWQELPTTWDPASRIASASVSRLGTFALSVHVYSVYLPTVSRNASYGGLAAQPLRGLSYYKPGR